MTEDKCEFYKEEDVEISLFETEKKYICTLEKDDCILEGDDKVCPYRLGIYY